MKTIFAAMLLLVLSWNAMAQPPCTTFVKHFDGIGRTDPRIFKDSAGTKYFLTARSNDTIFISGVNPAGNILWSRSINFPGDAGSVTDMIVDRVDGTLAGVVRGLNNNFIFKYNYSTGTFNWIKSYPANYIFENIHHIGTNAYFVTGEIQNGVTTIFRIDRNTGLMSSAQGTGFIGNFLSTYDGKNIYGASWYFSSGSLFNSSLFRFNATMNVWTKTYIQNVAAPSARIYPVAPVVDKSELVQLSSGDDSGFDTYQTGPTEVWLLKTDLDGVLAWTKRISIGAAQLNAKKIINTATGYYLLIDSYNGVTNNYFYVVKTDKNGVVQWTNRYGISGENSVISGVEDNGALYLTAQSGSYSTGGTILLLKLDAQGMTDTLCSYVQPVTAYDYVYPNTEVVKPTVLNMTNYANTPATAMLSNITASEQVHCATTCAPACSTLSGSLANGVLAFYPFGNGSLNDLSGNGNTLTNTTTAHPTTDRSGITRCAYHFDQVNGDFLNIPATTSGFLNNITTAPFSVSLWYQPTGTRPGGAYELLIGRGTAALHCPDTRGEWSIGLHDCRKAVVGFDQGSYWEYSSITNCNTLMTSISNHWHHLAFVYDGVNYNLYKDGILYSSTFAGGSCGAMAANIGPMLLGADYTGDLDDIIIYNRALSTAEVNTLRSLSNSCCDGASSTFRYTVPKAMSGNTRVKVYPNPTEGQLSVSAGNNIIRSILVYDNTGRPLGTYHFDAATVTVAMDHLPPGIYFLKITTDTETSVEKVIRK